VNRRLLAALTVAILSFAGCGGDDDGGGGDHVAPDASGQPDASAPDAGGVAIHVHTLLGVVPGNAYLVAAQNGDGAWQVLGGTDGEYSFDAYGRYGVLMVCPQGDGATVNFTHATPDELTDVWADCDGEFNPYGSVDVTMNGLDANDQALANLYFQSHNFEQATNTFTFPGIEAGTRELVAAIANNTDAADRFMIVRDIAVTDGNSTNVTFSENNSTPLEPFTIDFAPPGGFAFTTMSVELTTEHGSRGFLRAGPAVDGEYLGAPSGALMATDLHFLTQEWRAADGSQQVASMRWFHTLADQTMEQPTPVDATVSVGETAPYLRPHIAISGQESVQLYTASFSQIASARQVTWHATAGYLAGGDIDWTMPDLTSLDGWDASWQLVDGEEIRWNSFALSTNTDSARATFLDGPYDLPFTRADWDGRQDSRTINSGTFTP
jgi:hypothetical protein